jgi:hypothetical protein
MAEAEAKVPISEQLDLLHAYRIYVDHKLIDHKYFEQLSMALGATVVQDPKEGISILVHGPKDNKGRVSKLAQNAMENLVHVVAPAWLKDCYVSRSFHDPHLYPCDYKEKMRLTKPRTVQDDNPFGLAVDVLESTVSQPTPHIPTQEKSPSPEPEVRGIETERQKSPPTQRQKSPPTQPPRSPRKGNVQVRELLKRKRKEQEEKEKSQGTTKKPKKDGSLTSFFGSTNRMSIRYGESARYSNQ